MTFAAVNNHINSSDSSWFICYHHFPSFNYFTVPTELYKIALVPISSTYHDVELCWLTSQAKMPKPSLFSYQKVSFSTCLQFMGHSLFIMPENLYSQQSLELYTYLPYIQGLPEPTNVPVAKHMNYQTL